MSQPPAREPVAPARPAFEAAWVWTAAAAAVPVLGLWLPNFLALVPAVMVVALAAARWGRGLGWPRPSAALVVLAAALLLWAALSILWAINPARSMQRFASVAGATVFGAALAAFAEPLVGVARRRVEAALVAGLVLALAMIWLEGVTNFVLHQFVNEAVTRVHVGKAALNPGSIVCVLFLWVAALFLLARPGARAWGPTVALFALGAAALWSFGSQSPRVGFGVGVVAALLAWGAVRAGLSQRLIAATLAGAIALAAASAPFTARALKANLPTLPITDQSAVDRVHIWDFSANRLLERPAFGWGFLSSRYVPGAREPSATGGQSLPQHPHNAVLQLWLELGVPGLLWFVAAIGLVLWRIARAGLSPPRFAAAIGLVVSALAYLNLSFGVWQTWWQSTLWLAAAFAALALGRARSDRMESI